MITGALFALLVAPLQAESPRLRTILSNGTTLLVETMPGAKGVSVQLFAGVRGVRETEATHGHRHLLEHLLLKGKGGNLGYRLESDGIYLLGRTFRDAMQVELVGPASKVDLMLAALDEVLSPAPISAEQIAKELQIMRHEFAQQGDASLLSHAAWQAGFGSSALHPLGDLAKMGQASPESLANLFSHHFSPGNLVVIVSGPVEKVALTERLRKQFQDREGPEVRFDTPRKGAPGRVETDSCFGEVRGALVKDVKEAGVALAAAYAIAARLDGAYVTYTPSVGEGLVFVGRTDRNNTVGTFIDAMTEGDEAFLMPIGKVLAQRWLASLLTSPSGNGYVRGLLMAQKPGASAEELVKAISSVSWTQFHEAVTKFRKDHAAIAVGVRG